MVETSYLITETLFVNVVSIWQYLWLCATAAA
jgi:hypothetical protein